MRKRLFDQGAAFSLPAAALLYDDLMNDASQSRIGKLSLAGTEAQDSSVSLFDEQRAALHDLTQGGHFQPAGDIHGPYDLRLSIEENRLVFRLRNIKEEDLPLLALSLQPYRRLIHDYFLMVQGYEESRRSAPPERLEAIDMGRRSLHNEGAELLIERLKGKIDIDFETARRMFTLICVLHRKFIVMP
jgi:uncharacterized protein (UPF0262 family)